MVLAVDGGLIILVGDDGVLISESGLLVRISEVGA